MCACVYRCAKTSTDFAVKGILLALLGLSHDLVGKVGVVIHGKQTTLGAVKKLLSEKKIKNGRDYTTLMIIEDDAQILSMGKLKYPKPIYLFKVSLNNTKK